jgi:hypothetical protein
MVLFDVNWARLGPDTPDPIEDLQVDFALVELAGGYRLKQPLHVLFGFRYVTMDVELETGGLPLPPPLPSPSIRKQASQDWIDPYVGLRLELPMSEKWTFFGRSDIGGFGVGSDFAWNIAALFQRELTRRTSLIFGAGLLDVDYEDGSGQDLFVYDIRHQGLIMALNFHL